MVGHKSTRKTNPRRIAFTDAALAKLKPEASDYDVSDTGELPLYLRVYKSGRKTFFLRLRDPKTNKPYRWNMGLAGTYTCNRSKKTDLPYLRDAAMALISRAKDTNLRDERDDERQAEEARVTLRKFAKGTYKRRSKHLHPQVTINRVIQSFPELLDLSLTDIDAKAINGWMDSPDRAHLAEATFRSKLNALSSVLTMASRLDLIDFNPLHSEYRNKVKTEIEMPGESEERIRALSDDEKARLLDVLEARDIEKLNAERRTYDHYKNSANRKPRKPKKRKYYDLMTPIILTAMHTGYRKAALLRMRWHDPSNPGDDVVWDGQSRTSGVIRMRRQDKRQKNVAQVPFGATLAAVLREWEDRTRRKSCPFVFHDNGVVPKQFTKRWQTILQDARIEDFRFHDLRHCYASDLLKRKVDEDGNVIPGAQLHHIQKLLAHSKIDTTRRYAHTDEAELRDVVGQLDLLQ